MARTAVSATRPAAARTWAARRAPVTRIRQQPVRRGRPGVGEPRRRVVCRSPGASPPRSVTNRRRQPFSVQCHTGRV